MKRNVENLLINSVMMRLVLLTIMLTLNLHLMINAQTKKADFTGDWIFNLSKSIPSVRGSDTSTLTMAITQNDSILTTTYTRNNIKQYSQSITLDGKEHSRGTWSLGTPIKYVSTWSEDGRTLVMVTTSTIKTGELKMTRVWKLVNPNTLSIARRTFNSNGTKHEIVDVFERKISEPSKAVSTLSKIQTINTDGAAQKTENTYEDISTNLPIMDLHVHLNYAAQSLGNAAADAYEKASALSKEMGVTFGIAEEFATNNIRINDSLLLNRLALAEKNSLYLGLQVARRDWQKLFSKEALSKLDYILGDAMIFPNKDGKMLYIWVAGMPLGEPQEFMDRYVAHNLKVLSEPITIWANPTYLPDILISRYDELWTDARMKSLIDAAVKNNVAIEINSRFKVPNARFIKMAKAAGAHFTFGTNQHGIGVGEISWSISMAKECGLTMKDFFIPERKL